LGKIEKGIFCASLGKKKGGQDGHYGELEAALFSSQEESMARGLSVFHHSRRREYLCGEGKNWIFNADFDDPWLSGIYLSRDIYPFDCRIFRVRSCAEVQY
jgi:hypothetical protein